MAVRISRPGGRFTRISPAPSYGAVISRYSDQIKQAIDDQDQAEIELKILSYKNGGLSWEDLKNFMEKKIIGTPEGTLKQTQLQQSFVELANFETERRKQTERAKLEAQKADQGITPKERYEIESKLLKFEDPGTEGYVRQQAQVIESYEAAKTQEVFQEREKLLKQYGADGTITTEEEFLINQRLKEVAPPDSQIYNQLVGQEQQLREQMTNERRAAGQQAVSTSTERIINKIKDDEARNDLDYLNGRITGLRRDELREESAQEFRSAIQQRINAGLSVDKEDLKLASEIERFANELVKGRRNGEIFDVIGPNGEIVPVTLNGQNPLTGERVNYQDYSNAVHFDETTGEWIVIDPSSGQQFSYKEKDPKTGKEVTRTGFSGQDKALAMAKRLNYGTFDTVMSSREGKPVRVTMGRDADTGVFYDIQNPNKIFFNIPQDPQGYTRFASETDPNWRTNPNSKKDLLRQAQIFQSVGLKLPFGSVEFEEDKVPQKPKGVADNIGDFFKSINDPKRQAEANARGEKLIKEDLPQLPGKIVQGVTQGVQDIAKDPGRALQQVGQTFGQTALSTNPVTAPFMFANTLGKTLTGRDVIGDVLSNVSANIGPVAQSIGQSFGQTSRSVQQAPTALSQTFANIGSNIGSTAKDISSGFSKIFKLPELNLGPIPKASDFGSFGSSLGSSFNSGIKSFSQSFAPKVDFLGGIKKVASGVANFAGGLFNKAKGLFGF